MALPQVVGMFTFETTSSPSTSRIQQWTVGVVHLVGLAILTVMIATSPHHLVYDERNSMPNVQQLQKYGVGVDFLRSMTHGAGPLYAIVYAGFEPLTGLTPPHVRLVNLLLLIPIIALLWLVLWREHAQHPFLAATSLISIPITWVIAGMALTEIPAMIFAATSLCCLSIGYSRQVNLPRRRRCNRWFLIGGIALGMASLGRQPHVVVAMVPFLIAARYKSGWAAAACYAAPALLLTAPVFVAWQGLVPPNMATHGGVAPLNGLLSLSYAGTLMFFVVPRIYLVRLRAGLIIGGGALAANLMFRFFDLRPMSSLAARLMSTEMMTFYGIVCGALFVTVGLYFGWLILFNYLRTRESGAFSLVCTLSCMALIATSAGVAVHFSSRHTMMSMPFFIALFGKEYSATWVNVALSTIGCCLGALILGTYYV